MPSADDYRARLIAARARLEISPTRMAARLLTPHQTYLQWESGQRRTPGVAVVAAEALRPEIRYAHLWRDDSITARVSRRCDGSMTVSDIAEMENLSIRQVRDALKELRRQRLRPHAVAADHLGPRPSGDAS
jgi:hypothetical protein